MAGLDDGYGLAAAVFASEPWRSRLSAVFGVAACLLVISALAALLQRVIRGETARLLKCSAGISFLAVGGLLILGAQQGILHSYAAWLQSPSLRDVFPRAVPAPPADAPNLVIFPAAKALKGDLLVSVISARVMPTPAPARSSSRAVRPQRRAVVLTVRMENLSKTRTLAYRPWSSDFADPAQHRATLSDNHGNHYPCVGRFHGNVTVEAASLSAGQSATDTLTFRPLAAAAEEFALYLPTRNFGQDGALTIEIPAGIIVVDPGDFPTGPSAATEPSVPASATEPSAEPEAPAGRTEATRTPAERLAGDSEAVRTPAESPADNAGATPPARPAGNPLPGQAETYDVGQTFDLATWRYCVSSRQWSDSLPGPAARAIQPEAGHRFLTVVLTAQNISSSTSLLPHVQLADEDGLCHDPCYKSGGDADGLPVGSQASVSREFTFYVPAARAYRLRVFDGWLATRTAEVRIDAGR